MISRQSEIADCAYCGHSAALHDQGDPAGLSWCSHWDEEEAAEYEPMVSPPLPYELEPGDCPCHQYGGTYVIGR